MISKDLIDYKKNLVDLFNYLDKLSIENKKLNIYKVALTYSSNIYHEKLNYVDKVLKYFLSFIKAIKDKDDDFEKTYCEREWRSTEIFNFQYADVAMIVLPKSFFSDKYDYRITEFSNELNLPRSIPIIPWEDLVEH